MSFPRLSLLSLVIGLCILAPSVFAQPKPPPPFMEEPKGPPPPDVRGFKAAYERAKEPNVLVICGVAIPPRQMAGQSATGLPAAENFVGANVSLFDDTGDAGVLKGQMEEYLRQAGAEVVNLD